MNANRILLLLSVALFLPGAAGCATTRAEEMGEVAIDADPPGGPRETDRSKKTVAYRQCVGLATEDCHKKFVDNEQALACYHARLQDCRREPEQGAVQKASAAYP